ncbi:MAG: transglycosylase SLT domain-containing protein [Kovacikia sp.]
MRIKTQKRRSSKRGSHTLGQALRQATGHFLTFVESLCDRSLVSRRRLHKLVSRTSLRPRKFHPPTPCPRELHPQPHRFKSYRKARKSLFFRLYPGGVFILSLLIFLNNPGSGAYSWKFNPPFLRPEKNGHPSSKTIPDKTLTRLRVAIVQQESNGNHKLLNPSGSGAMGIAQVMPEDLPHWSQEALGREVSPQEFLNNPDLQVAIIDYKLSQYWQQASLQSHGNEDETVKRVASWWYAGDPHLFTNTTPQNWGGDEYPSIAEYCSQILERYKAQ